MTYQTWILVFHPVPLTIVVFALVAWLVVAKGYWRKYKRVILMGAAALYAVDTAFALPRIIYAWRSPDRAVVHRQLPLPASLVLVKAECREECFKRLASGELTEVILIDTDRWRTGTASPPTRYRAGAPQRDGCPDNRLRPYREYELRRAGHCPEPAEIPSEGIFVVSEFFFMQAGQRAEPVKSTHLVDQPPGRTIKLRAVEVQLRTTGHVEVLATRRQYQAPGLLGLPPLIGCWFRPENIIWTLPPGDTGCGLWRWFTWGGDWNWPGSMTDWVFSDVFTAPDRPVTPPATPQ